MLAGRVEGRKDYKTRKAECLWNWGTGWKFPRVWLELVGERGVWEWSLAPGRGGPWPRIIILSWYGEGEQLPEMWRKSPPGVHDQSKRFLWCLLKVSCKSQSYYSNEHYRLKVQQLNQKAKAVPRAPYCAPPGASLGFNMESGTKGRIVCQFSFLKKLNKMGQC